MHKERGYGKRIFQRIKSYLLSIILLKIKSKLLLLFATHKIY